MSSLLALSRMGSALRLGISAWLSLFLIAGCSSDPADPEAEIRLLLQAGEEAVEARSLTSVAPYLAESYQDSQGQDKKGVLRLLGGYFLTHQSIHVLSQVTDFRFEEPTRARVTLYVAVAGDPIESTDQLVSLRADLLRVELELNKRDEEWQVISGSWRKAGPSDFVN